MEQKRPGMVHYFSTVNGFAGRDSVYYGFTVKVPKDDFDKAAQSASEEMQKFEAFLANLPKDLEAAEPIERYETRDIETGELLIMWRLPIREKKSDSRPGKNQTREYIH